METKLIEVTNGPRNWGKFMLGRFTPDEWAQRSAVDDSRLIAGRGWGPSHLLVLDLQTGEGAIFHPGGLAHADLNKHKIWVCPMYEPFLGWLYQQDLSDLSALPPHVDLPDVEFEWAGYRRPGIDLKDLVERLQADPVFAASVDQLASDVDAGVRREPGSLEDRLRRLSDASEMG